MIEHSAATLQRRKTLSRTWAGLVVGWSLVRAAVVWAALSDYGINPWIYLAIDLGSAAVEAFTTPKMVLAFIDDHYRQAAKWAGLSLVAFVIPDLYIVLGTRTLPTKIIVVVATVITVTSSIAIIGVIRKILIGRRVRKKYPAMVDVVES